MYRGGGNENRKRGYLQNSEKCYNKEDPTLSRMRGTLPGKQMALTHTSSQYRLGLVLAFGSLLWGGTFNALAKGLTPFLSPMTLLVLSEALTALFIIITFGVVSLL